MSPSRPLNSDLNSPIPLSNNPQWRWCEDLKSKNLAPVQAISMEIILFKIISGFSWKITAPLCKLHRLAWALYFPPRFIGCCAAVEENNEMHSSQRILMIRKIALRGRLLQHRYRYLWVQKRKINQTSTTMETYSLRQWKASANSVRLHRNTMFFHELLSFPS